jgi:murein L,D-transpeptidase YafK
MNILGALLSIGLLSVSATAATATSDPTVILVDKKTNTVSVAYYKPEGYQIIATYRATIGQVKGDKVEEGDLKTPEGIYVFTQRLTAPTLKPKFGGLAFYINYPNVFDKMAGSTGFDIMLHSTDTPERLKLDLDSEGCIVVDIADLKKIEPYIHVGLTPVLVFNELTDEYKAPEKDSRVKNFFYSWVKAWEGKDLENYIAGYHDDFSADGKNKDQWRIYKASLNGRYKAIQIKPEHVQIYRHPKYSMVAFVQNYRSTLMNGATGHVSRGTKMIYIAEEDGNPRIIWEDFTPRTWR